MTAHLVDVAALFDAAADCYATQRYSEAATAFQRLRDHARRTHDQRAAADAAYQLGNVLRTLSHYDEAEQMFNEALAYAVDHGPRTRVGDCHLGFGNVHRGRSRYAEARAAYRAAQSIYDAEGESTGYLDVMINLAVVDYLASDYAEAQSAFEALLLTRTPPLNTERAMACRTTLANVLRERGRFGEAEELLMTAREHYVQSGDRIAVADCDLNLGNVYSQTGREDQADRVWRAARKVFNNAGLRERGADCTLNLGLLAVQREQISLAIQRFESARAVYAALGLVEHTADCISDIGFAHLIAGDPAAACRRFTEAQRLYRRHRLDRNPDWTAAIGEARRRQGRFASARKHFRRARAAYVERNLGFDVAHMQMREAQAVWDDIRSEPNPRLRAERALRSAVPGLLTTDDVRYQFASARDRAAWAHLAEGGLALVLDIADSLGDVELLGDLVESFTSVGWYAVGPDLTHGGARSARYVSTSLRFGERTGDDPRAVFDDLVLPLRPTPPLRVLGPSGPRVALAGYPRTGLRGSATQTPLVTW